MNELEVRVEAMAEVLHEAARDFNSAYPAWHEAPSFQRAERRVEASAAIAFFDVNKSARHESSAPLTPEVLQVGGAAIAELMYAMQKFPAFTNRHEGYAIILEELDELWEDIKAKAPVEKVRVEAMEVSAMAMRFIHDLCPWKDWGVVPGE